MKYIHHIPTWAVNGTWPVTASISAPLAAGDAGRYAGLAAELSLVFGVFCLAAWLLRLGFVAEMLSRPVLVGYISGVAVIMAVGQLDKVTGIPVRGSNLWSQARSLFGHLSEFRPAAAGVAAGTIALLLLLHRYWPGGPGALIAVVVMTVLVAATGLDRHGVVLTGTFTGGLLRPHLPPIGNLDQLLLPAVGILIVGYTDNILTARSFASRAGYEVNANQELLALGACNVGSAVVGGFPVSSSASRTALGAAAGSRTQLYSLTALAAVLGTLVFLRPALAHFPRAALGGLVIYAAVRLVDLAEFRRLARFRRQELLLALAATAGVLTFDILYGVLLAVGLSIAALLSHVARPHDAILGSVAGLPGMHDVDDYPDAAQIPGMLIYRYDSPLIFANAGDSAVAATRGGPSGPPGQGTTTLATLASCSPSRTSSRTCARIWLPTGWWTRSGKTCCSPPCLQPSTATHAGSVVAAPLDRSPETVRRQDVRI